MMKNDLRNYISVASYTENYSILYVKAFSLYFSKRNLDTICHFCLYTVTSIHKKVHLAERLSPQEMDLCI